MAPTTWRDLTERHLAIGSQRKILLVEDDDLYVERMRQVLINAHPHTFSMEVSRTLAHASQAIP